MRTLNTVLVISGLLWQTDCLYEGSKTTDITMIAFYAPCEEKHQTVVVVEVNLGIGRPTRDQRCLHQQLPIITFLCLKQKDMGGCVIKGEMFLQVFGKCGVNLRGSLRYYCVAARTIYRVCNATLNLTSQTDGFVASYDYPRTGEIDLYSCSIDIVVDKTFIMENIDCSVKMIGKHNCIKKQRFLVTRSMTIAYETEKALTRGGLLVYFRSLPGMSLEVTTNSFGLTSTLSTHCTKPYTSTTDSIFQNTSNISTVPYEVLILLGILCALLVAIVFIFGLQKCRRKYEATKDNLSKTDEGMASFGREISQDTEFIPLSEPNKHLPEEPLTIFCEGIEEPLNPITTKDAGRNKHVYFFVDMDLKSRDKMRKVTTV